MQFREAIIDDITQMQVVRNSVKENVLSDPALDLMQMSKIILPVVEKVGFAKLKELLLVFQLPIWKDITFGHFLFILIMKEKVLAKNFTG